MRVFFTNNDGDEIGEIVIIDTTEYDIICG